MFGNWLVVVLSIAAAFAFALSSSFKHVSAGHVPDAQSLHPGKLVRFVRATLSQRLWLAGLCCDAVGLALQIFALHLGALAVVQPLLLSSLLFALLIRARFEHHAISRHQSVWALVLTATLAASLLLASPSASVHPANRVPAVIAGIAGAVLVSICLVLGRRQRTRERTATLIGIAVGVIFAATAALLKAATNIATRGPLALLGSWQLYAVIALGAAGLLLSQLSFQAAPLTASLPATATVDPLLSVLVGVVVYGEHIHHGAGTDLILFLLLAILATAVVQLSRTMDLAPAAT